MYKECRWLIFCHVKIFYTVSTPAPNFFRMNPYLYVLWLDSSWLGLAAGPIAFNKYLPSWFECVLFQAAFKSLTLLFHFFFLSSTHFKYLINFKKKKHIKKKVLPGHRTQALPFREAKSHHHMVSGSTSHHSHFPNAVSADAWNSFNRGQHIALSS